MDGAVIEAQYGCGPLHRGNDLALNLLRKARGGQENRLLENGPSMGSGLSSMANVRSSPPTTIPSSATSRPGRYRSIKISAPDSPLRLTPSLFLRILRIRFHARTNSSGVSARITPRLAESESGLRTQGNGEPDAASAGSLWSGATLNQGDGNPAAAILSRMTALLRTDRTASGEWCVNPRASDAAAATCAKSSSAATIAARE